MIAGYVNTMLKLTIHVISGTLKKHNERQSKEKRYFKKRGLSPNASGVGQRGMSHIHYMKQYNIDGLKTIMNFMWP